MSNDTIILNETLALLRSATDVQEALVAKVSLLHPDTYHERVSWTTDWDRKDGRVVFDVTYSYQGCGDETQTESYSLEHLLSPDFVALALAEREAERVETERIAKMAQENERVRKLAEKEAQERQLLAELKAKYEGNPGFDAFRQEGGGFGQ